MSLSRLTPHQSKFYRQLMRFIHKHGFAPTYREMVTEFGLSSTAVASHYVEQLKRKGYLIADSSRAIVPLIWMVEVLVKGKVSAGGGVSPVDEWGPLEVPADLFRPLEDMYALEVKGDSMKGAGIEDGDLILVEDASRVDNGQIAVFRFASPVLPDGEMACKIFRQQGSVVELRSVNPNYPPRCLPAGEVQVQGKAIGVYRTAFEDWIVLRIKKYKEN